MKKRLLFMLVVLTTAMTMRAGDEVTIDGIKYDVVTKAKVATVIKGGNNNGNFYVGDIVIPSSITYNNVVCNVTGIGGSAFSNCTGLTSISIPNSVTSIGGSAFSGCSSLTSISIPNSVTSIGGSAFFGCSSLTSISIPNSVTSIGGAAFSGCSGLTSIDIPNSVTSIGGWAFNGCSSLTSIDIPNSVTSIGVCAFAGCTGLTTITVDPSNTVYDSRNNCNAIIETASNTLVNACNNSIIPESVTSIGERAFEGCSGLTSIDIPNSVTSIGERAFEGCSGLTSIDIPNSVTSIGSWAFNGCSSLTSISIPNSVTSIAFGAFQDCSSLTSIDIPNSVTSIRGVAFSGCSSLTSIDIPNSVTSIAYGAFQGCSSLTSIDIPNSVTSIDDNAFYGCSGLTSIDIPNSVTSIGGAAFQGCSSLSSIKIPDAVTIIGFEAFYNCSNLKNVEIGSGITYFTNNMSYQTLTFGSCNNLELVTCHATSIPSYTDKWGDPTGGTTNDHLFLFEGSDVQYATLIVPDEAYDAYSTTTPWSEFGTILKMSEASVVTANSYTREYGEQNPTFEYTSAQTLNGAPAISCAADATSAPGTYPISISQGTATNTGLIFVDGTLTITKAPLTAKVNSYTINEGDALPTFDATYTGLKNSEAETVLNPVFTCAATDGNTPGIYDITLTTTTDNYDVTIEQGTLTILPSKMSITISDVGVATYCSAYDLDFSTVTDFKAYIATGYNRSTGNVIVQAVKDVPAGTGLFLKGTPGSYDVPCGESSSYYMNMLVGATEATTIQATEGSKTNFVLYATNSSDACFRPLTSTYNLKANRAYLQVPTSMVGSSAGANAIGIEFEEGVTGIEESVAASDETGASWFSLDGRKLNSKPTQKGIYVVNGRKVVVK